MAGTHLTDLIGTLSGLETQVETVESAGGEVVLAPCPDGHSTGSVIQRAQVPR